MPLDKLRFHNILVHQLNAPSAAAEELATVVDEATSGLATQQQLADLEAKLDARFARIDARFARIDAHFDGIDIRFASIDTRFDGLEARTREQIWRAVVVVIGVLGAVGAAIIALLIAILAQI